MPGFTPTTIVCSLENCLGDGRAIRPRALSFPVTPWVYRWLSANEQTNHVEGMILPIQGGLPAGYNHAVKPISLSSKPKETSAENLHAQNDTASISRESETAHVPSMSLCPRGAYCALHRFIVAHRCSRATPSACPAAWLCVSYPFGVATPDVQSRQLSFVQRYRWTQIRNNCSTPLRVTALTNTGELGDHSSTIIYNNLITANFPEPRVIL